jgi:hypothetical protein
MTEFQEYLFGIFALSTHRPRDIEHAPFPYELAIAAISIGFFRSTIPLHVKEPRSLRWFFAAVLAVLAYTNKSYELICAVEIFSYAVPFFLYSDWPERLFLLLSSKQQQQHYKDDDSSSSRNMMEYSKLLRLLGIALSALLSFLFCHLVASGDLFLWVRRLTPFFIQDFFTSMFPISEVQAAYDIIDRFVLEPGLLPLQVSRLLFITFHCQVAIGYVGIDFLKQEQQRRNELVRMDMLGGDDDDDDVDNDVNDVNHKDKDGKTKPSKDDAANANANNQEEKLLSSKERRNMQRKLKKSKQFQRTAAPFIFYMAVPYMIKIISIGNLNAFAYACFKDDVHRAVRLYDLFDNDNHLVAIANHSAKSPEGTIYDTMMVLLMNR